MDPFQMVDILSRHMNADEMIAALNRLAGPIGADPEKVEPLILIDPSCDRRELQGHYAHLSRGGICYHPGHVLTFACGGPGVVHAACICGTSGPIPLEPSSGPHSLAMLEHIIAARSGR
jgi:hypothetical protein